MGLLDGKIGLVVGIANERSYAWFIAQSLIKGAPHPNAGKLWINWSLTEKGQQLLGDLGYGPVRQGIVPKLEEATPQTPGEALKLMATTLMSTVGGAAGPLYGTAYLRLTPRDAGPGAGSERPDPVLRVEGTDPLEIYDEPGLPDETMTPDVDAGSVSESDAVVRSESMIGPFRPPNPGD